MRTTTTIFAALLCLGLSAQQAAPVTPVAVDLHLAGAHLEKAGKQRNMALATVLLSGALGGAMVAMDSEQAGPAGALIGIGVAVGVGFNIGANGHERKAGRILQGKP